MKYQKKFIQQQEENEEDEQEQESLYFWLAGWNCFSSHLYTKLIKEDT